MNRKALAILGAASVAGTAWALRRRVRQEARENARWAAATDSVAPTPATAASG